MSVKIEQGSLHSLPLPDSSGLVCVSYAPGHNVHWIQALRSANDKEVAAKTWSGKVITIEGEVVTVLRKTDGSLARFRTHDPALLAAIVQQRGSKVTVNDQYCIMRAGITRKGSTCISVRPERLDPWPCKIDDLPPAASDTDICGSEE